MAIGVLIPHHFKIIGHFLSNIYQFQAIIGGKELMQPMYSVSSFLSINLSTKFLPKMGSLWLHFFFTNRQCMELSFARFPWLLIYVPSWSGTAHRLKNPKLFDGWLLKDSNGHIKKWMSIGWSFIHFYGLQESRTRKTMVESTKFWWTLNIYFK